MSELSVTIVITSKNRKDELRKCLQSCIGLKAITEVLVCDDGSDDGTYDMVKAEFPGVSLYRNETSMGLINARTHCAGLAKGEVIVSIDDDCCFDGEDTIAEAIMYFSHPRVAAITIPVIDVLKSSDISQKGIGTEGEYYISSQYRGCAHAVKRSVFLKLGGYYNNLGRQEEETEFAMRLYSDGYVIRVANCEKPILHYHSASRNYSLIAFYRARNKILVCYRYSPVILLPLELFRLLFSLIRYEIKHKQLKACISGFGDAVAGIFSGKVKRARMPLSKYIFFKRLRIKGVQKIQPETF